MTDSGDGKGTSASFTGVATGDANKLNAVAGFDLSGANFDNAVTTLTASSAGSVASVVNKMPKGKYDNAALTALLNRGIENQTEFSSAAGDAALRSQLLAIINANKTGADWAVDFSNGKAGAWTFDMGGATFDVTGKASIKGLMFNNSKLNVGGDLTIGSETQNYAGLNNTDATVGGTMAVKGINVNLSGQDASHQAKIQANKIDISGTKLVLSSVDMASATRGSVTANGDQKGATALTVQDTALKNLDLTATSDKVGVSLTGQTSLDNVKVSGTTTGTEGNYSRGVQTGGNLTLRNGTLIDGQAPATTGTAMGVAVGGMVTSDGSAQVTGYTKAGWHGVYVNGSTNNLTIIGKGGGAGVAVEGDTNTHTNANFTGESDNGITSTTRGSIDANADLIMPGVPVVITDSNFTNLDITGINKGKGGGIGMYGSGTFDNVKIVGIGADQPIYGPITVYDSGVLLTRGTTTLKNGATIYGKSPIYSGVLVMSGKIFGDGSSLVTGETSSTSDAYGVQVVSDASNVKVQGTNTGTGGGAIVHGKFIGGEITGSGNSGGGVYVASSSNVVDSKIKGASVTGPGVTVDAAVNNSPVTGSSQQGEGVTTGENANLKDSPVTSESNTVAVKAQQDAQRSAQRNAQQRQHALQLHAQQQDASAEASNTVHGLKPSVRPVVSRADQHSGREIKINIEGCSASDSEACISSTSKVDIGS